MAKKKRKTLVGMGFHDAVKSKKKKKNPSKLPFMILKSSSKLCTAFFFFNKNWPLRYYFKSVMFPLVEDEG